MKSFDLLCCQNQKQSCIHFNDHLQIRLVESGDHLTDEQQHCSWQKSCQTVAGQGPADDEICEQSRPTFSIHLAVVHFSKVVFSNITAASVHNIYRSQLNVVAQNFLMNVATLCVKWIPFIFKITNIICCPTPILRKVIF